MKKIITCLVAGLLMVLMAIPVLANDYIVDDTSQKVYDYAAILTEEQRDSLESYAGELSEKYDADFVIVTINENNRSSSQDFADRFFDDNYFGQKDGKKEYGKGDGMVFLIDMDYRQFSLSTAGLVHKAMGDDEVDDLLDHAAVKMRTEDYYGACMTSLDESADAVKGHLAVRGVISIAAPLGLAAVVSAIVLFVLMSFSKKSKAAVEAGRYIVPNSLHITHEYEVKTGSHTSVSRKPDSSSKGGGGGGSHVSSGGASHGGGSRSF